MRLAAENSLAPSRHLYRKSLGAALPDAQAFLPSKDGARHSSQRLGASRESRGAPLERPSVCALRHSDHQNHSAPSPKGNVRRQLCPQLPLRNSRASDCECSTAVDKPYCAGTSTACWCQPGARFGVALQQECCAVCHLCFRRVLPEIPDHSSNDVFPGFQFCGARSTVSNRQ